MLKIRTQNIYPFGIILRYLSVVLLPSFAIHTTYDFLTRSSYPACLIASSLFYRRLRAPYFSCISPSSHLIVDDNIRWIDISPHDVLRMQLSYVITDLSVPLLAKIVMFGDRDASNESRQVNASTKCKFIDIIPATVQVLVVE